MRNIVNLKRFLFYHKYVLLVIRVFTAVFLWNTYNAKSISIELVLFIQIVVLVCLMVQGHYPQIVASHSDN